MEIHLWRWLYVDDLGERRDTRYLLTEDETRSRLRDPVKVEGSLEVRSGQSQFHVELANAVLIPEA